MGSCAWLHLLEGLSECLKPAGFQVEPRDVHLETRNDHPGQRTGTGIAYVQFASPEEAERARHSRHKQMLGPRYIECMVFVPGWHQLPFVLLLSKVSGM